MTNVPTELNQPISTTGVIQARCWCGAMIEAATMPCPCGGGMTVAEHPGCGTTISGAHSEGCTYMADNLEICVTCGHDNEHCGGSNIFSRRSDSCRCHLFDENGRPSASLIAR